MRSTKLNRAGIALVFLCSGLGLASGAGLPAPDGDDGGLTLRPGFRALVVADKLGRIRFITVATNGDIYIKKQRSGLIALRDSQGTGRADVVRSFGEELGSGTGVSVHGSWLYFSTDDAVYRYKLTPGDLVPAGPPEPIVVGLPPGQRQHESKAFAFDDRENLYVEVGCPSNASGNPDRALGAKGVDPAELFLQHGGFWRFDANTPNQDQVKDGFHFSTGMRHALSVAWQPVSKELFVAVMGRDQLNTVDPTDYTPEDNAELPAEEFHLLKEGANFGWPYTYWDTQKKARMVAPEFGGDNQKMDTSGKYPDPLVALPAHWAPMQMTFYSGTNFPPRYLNGAFVASHGSWNRAPLPQAGYKLLFIPFNEKGMPVGNYEVFADNFAGVPIIKSPGDAHYRPCGVAVGPDGSLYVADSEKGRLWRIIYAGKATSTAQPTSKPSSAPVSAAPAAASTSSADLGVKVYDQTCAICHMADGSGVATMQPPLIGDPVVAGDPVRLVHIVLEGPAKVLPANRPHWGDTMPPLAQLSNEQIAAVLSHVRRQYGSNAPAISPDLVARIRGEIAGAPAPASH